MTDTQTAPDWSAGSLASVLPSVADRLGVSRYAGRDVFDLPAVAAHRRRARRRPRATTCCSSAAVTRRSCARHLATARRIPCGFPTTTATSMGSLGTGLLPGRPRARRHAGARSRHRPPRQRAVVGGRARPACAGSPTRRSSRRLEDAGVGVTMVGPWYFKGSGLTTAALRGGGFRSGASLDDRVDAAASAVREPRALARLPLLGRGRQGRSRARLPVVAVGRRGRGRRRARSSRLAARVPDDTSIVITADHGMVDVPFEARIDLADEPELMRRHTASRR